MPIWCESEAASAAVALFAGAAWEDPAARLIDSASATASREPILVGVDGNHP